MNEFFARVLVWACLGIAVALPVIIITLLVAITLSLLGLV